MGLIEEEDCMVSCRLNFNDFVNFFKFLVCVTESCVIEQPLRCVVVFVVREAVSGLHTCFVISS